MVAFDYEKQEWLEGEAARVVRVNQLREDLSTYRAWLRNGNVRFAWPGMTVVEALKGAEAELRYLNGGVL